MFLTFALFVGATQLVATLALACDQGKGGLQGVGLIVDPGAKLCERKTLSVNEDIDLFF